MNPSRCLFLAIINTGMKVNTSVIWHIIYHSCKHYGVRILSFSSHYKSVSEINWNLVYYGLIYIIDIYTHYLFFFLWYTQFRTIQGGCWLYSYTSFKGKYDILLILILQLDSYHQSLLFIFIWFSCFNFYSTKIRNNIV